MADGGVTVKKGRKFDQVLIGARDVFMRDGFEGASVDDIARNAGVSKATLYSYFPDKRLLFMEVAKLECARQSQAAIATIDRNASVDVVLRDIAQQLVGFIMSEFGRRIFRICVAESDRFPALGQEFYESGPMVARAAIMEYLTTAVDRGELAIEDIELAADQFAELCKADLFPRMVFKQTTEFSKAETSRVIKGAVEMFMARYGVTA